MYIVRTYFLTFSILCVFSRPVYRCLRKTELIVVGKFSFKALHLYLNDVLTLIPLGDEEQLGQAFRIAVADFCAKLPQELLLVLEELGVVFVVHNFF